MSEISRQYSSLTCSLTIVAKVSPLSQWTDQRVLKHLRFQLSFGETIVASEPNPISESQEQSLSPKLLIRGDRHHLESLCQTVDDYLQTFLLTSQIAEAWFPDLSPSGSPDLSATPELSTLPQAVITAPKARPLPPPVDRPILLPPISPFSHRLYLGPLATKASGATLQLSTVQLSDLAEILDQYQGEWAALPSLQRSHLRPVPNWLRVAAVMVLAAGVTTSMTRLINFSGTGLFPTTQPEAISDGSPSTQPTPESMPSSSLAEPLQPSSPKQHLFNQPPSAKVSENANASPKPPASPSNPVLPTTAQTQDPPKPAESSTLEPTSELMRRTFPQRDERLTPPSGITQPRAARSGSVRSPSPKPSQQPIASPTSPSDRLPSAHPEISSSSPSSAEASSTSEKFAPPTPHSLPQAAGLETSPGSLNPNHTGVNAQEPTAADLTPLYNASPNARAKPATPPAPAPQPPAPQRSLPPSPATSTLPAPANTTITAKASPMDISAQLAELQHFFEERWRPPENLTQNLEYKLFFANDGSLKDRIPLSPLAQRYVHRVGMPPLQQPFVEPFPAGSQPVVRLILQGDGQVKTVVEQVD